MREVVFNYQEFCSKVDRAKPVHHSGHIQSVRGVPFLYKVAFRIYGVSKDGHVIVFEDIQRVDGVGQELNEKVKALYSQLTEKFAKPLGSTEGRWES